MTHCVKPWAIGAAQGPSCGVNSIGGSPRTRRAWGFAMPAPAPGHRAPPWPLGLGALCPVPGSWLAWLPPANMYTHIHVPPHPDRPRRWVTGFEGVGGELGGGSLGRRKPRFPGPGVFKPPYSRRSYEVQVSGYTSIMDG